MSRRRTWENRHGQRCVWKKWKVFDEFLGRWLAKADIGDEFKHASFRRVLLPGTRQMSKRFLGSRASACVTAAWEDKWRNHECPRFLFISLSFYWWEGCYMGWNIPVVYLGQLSWLCALLMSCPPQVYWLGGTEWERESLDAVQALFSNDQNTTVLSALF